MSDTTVVHDLQVVGHRGNTPVLQKQFSKSLVGVHSYTETIGSTYRERTTITVIGPWTTLPVVKARKRWWQK